MRSMTGCGYGRVRRDGWEVTTELKTVNHRFLDIGMRLPRNISFLEQPIREQLARRIRRGHADVFLTVRNIAESSLEIEADYDLAAHYYEVSTEMSRKIGIANDMTVSRLMQMEGVTTVAEREMDREKVTEICGEALDQSIDQLIAMREAEGKNLMEDLRHHLMLICGLREKIAERAPGVVSEYRDKLNARLKILLNEEPDPVRIAQEVALTADRCAIDEELSRLQSHISQMETYLEEQDETGKKMDFLIQEMNRETNTIGSKASDAEIAKLVVDMKSEIEKIREQVQNVE